MIPADPIAAARDAVTLLQTGRAAMALRILEGLPDAIEAARRDAASDGFLQGQRAAHRVLATRRREAKTMPVTFSGASRLQELRLAVADREKRQLVLAALRIDERHLDLILAGRTKLASGQWKRIREVLA